MIGPRLTSVFKSRKSALLWAAMVLWSAYEFASVMPAHKSGEEAKASGDADVAAVKSAFSGE